MATRQVLVDEFKQYLINNSNSLNKHTINKLTSNKYLLELKSATSIKQELQKVKNAVKLVDGKKINFDYINKVHNVKQYEKKQKLEQKIFKVKQYEQKQKKQFEKIRNENNYSLNNIDVDEFIPEFNFLQRDNINVRKQINENVTKYIKNVNEEIYKVMNNPIIGNQTYKAVLKPNEYYNGRKLLKQIINKTSGNIIIKIGNECFTINDENRYRYINILSNEKVYVSSVYDSFGIFDVVSYDLENVEISKFITKHQRELKKGKFFNMFHNTIFDLKRYGIYNKNDEYNYNDCCLIIALKNGGLEENYIERIKCFVKNAMIPAKDINELCNKIKIKIILSYYGTNQIKKKIYGEVNERIFNIGLLNEHYFIIEQTNITRYAIEHYNEIKNEKEFNLIIGKNKNYYDKNVKRCINSFDVIKLMLDKKDELLIPMNTNDKIEASSQYKICDEIKNLTIYDNDCKLVDEFNNDDFELTEDNNEIKEEKKPFVNYFFDFETYTKDGKHIPYCCCYIGDDLKTKSFIGEDCGLQMLKTFNNGSKIRLIAHNAKYDCNFLVKYLTRFTECCKGTKIFSIKGTYYKVQIEIKDSYLLIPKPLRDFNECFKLTVSKEVMPYALYNVCGNVEKRFIKINDALKFINDEENKKIFLENIEKWGLKKNDSYDIINYSIKYCLIDCVVLKDGYNTFKKWMIECTNINIDNVLTIASLSMKYLILRGCYKNVYKISGIAQKFIQQCVIGGRVMVSENKKQIVNDIVNDFDAVALYPSAMYRIEGFLQGKPKIINTNDFNIIKNYDGYFIQIKIKKINKKYKFPLQSYIDKKTGVRNFTNDLEGKIIFIDKTALEDFIKFQGVEFEVIRGYYFDEGFNNKINDVILYIFNERLKKKKEKNPMQEVYKLIMNSGYGKNIMKEHDSITKTLNNEDAEIYISRNYNYIKSFVKVDGSDKVRIKLFKTHNEHFNIAHVGVQILSMSKRIMNEVMCIAEDNNCNIYYQDTDSMHITDIDIKKLSEVYNNKFNKELIGKNMGQFHSDFSLKYINKNGEKSECENIKAIKSIFLGKKTYIDKLIGETDTNIVKEGYHIRMKGIPNSTIEYTCEKLKIDPMQLFKKLYDGETVRFDLTNGGNKSNFKFNINFSVNTMEKFDRDLKFSIDDSIF